MDFSFPKKTKLKSKKLFDCLFTEGKTIKAHNIKLFYLQTELPAAVQFQVGVTVPKKNFRSAVKRNRIKRLLKEGYRLNKHTVFNNSESSFAFLFLYLGKEVPDYQATVNSIKEILQKFLKQTNDE